MKTKISIVMISIFLSVVLVSPASATVPVPVTITAILDMTGPNSAAGSFDISGLFADTGVASEQFFTSSNTIHGVKTLIGSEGTITIHFQAQLTWLGPTTAVAKGRFVIVSGTGAYEKLHGVGDTLAELDLVTGHLLATYTGEAHFD
jgi:hypothetical protein